MKQPSFNEFKNFYRERGMCMGDSHRATKPLNPTKLERKYKKYINKLNVTQEKLNVKRDSWNTVKNKIFQRDNNTCQLYTKLAANEKKQVSFLLDSEIFGTLDPAHVFGKGSYPHMKHDVDNIVSLYRLFHSRMDAGQDPLTGKSISKRRITEWWMYIVGYDRYTQLEERSKK